MSPSVSENRSVGKSAQKSAQISSAKVNMHIIGDSFIAHSAARRRHRRRTRRGAHMQAQHGPSSQAASYSGSQCRVWMEGIASASGFSENVTA